MEHAETTGLALATVGDRGRESATFPVILALHDRRGDGPDAVATTRAMFGEGPDILAPQAARPCNPFQSNLRGPSSYEGFSWYLGEDPTRPEAASFGDALAQLDRLLREQPGPCVISGHGQGGVLALTLALFAPDALVGVFASAAGLPCIGGWALPEDDLHGLDFLLANFAATQASKTRSLLVRRGARSVTTAGPDGAAPRSWFERLAAHSPRQGPAEGLT